MVTVRTQCVRKAGTVAYSHSVKRILSLTVGVYIVVPLN